jgi:hypothetical protein
MCFVGFTFKKPSEENNIKKIVSLFDEIESSRQLKKQEDKRPEQVRVEHSLPLKKDTLASRSARTQVYPLEIKQSHLLTEPSSTKENPLKQTNEARVVYPGPFIKGGINIQRSGSSDGKNRQPLEPMSSPKKPAVNAISYTSLKSANIITSSSPSLPKALRGPMG